MKLHHRLLGITLIVLAILARAETPTNPPLCVMTYNLRYASKTPPNAWPDRRPLVREVIQSVKPDVIGT